MGLEGLVRKIVRKLETGKRVSRVEEIVYTNQPRVDHPSALAADKKTATLGTGEKVDTVISGNPHTAELAVKLTDTTYYVVNQYQQPLIEEIFGNGYLIGANKITDGNGQVPYVVKQVDKDLLHPLDTYAISGATLEPDVDKINTVKFSPDGKHILVGATEVGGNDELILHWGVVTDFKLVDTPTPQVQGGLIQGVHTLTVNEVPNPPDPPAPAIPPPVVVLGPSSSENVPGDCIANTYTQQELQTFYTTPVEDPPDLSNDVFKHLLAGGNYEISINGLGGIVVDFVGNFRVRKSIARHFRGYRWVTNTTSTTLLELCLGGVNGCLDLIVRECIDVTETDRLYTYTWLGMNYNIVSSQLFNRVVSGSGCAGYNCPGDVGPPRSPPCNRPWIAMACGATSSSGSANYPLNVRSDPGVGLTFPFWSDRTWYLENAEWVYGTFALEDLGGTPALTTLGTRTASHDEGVVPTPVSGGILYPSVQDDTNNGGPEFTLFRPFKAKSGVSASLATNVHVSPRTYYNTTYITQANPTGKTYITQLNMGQWEEVECIAACINGDTTLIDSPAVFTDQRVYKDFLNNKPVRATDSYKFVRMDQDNANDETITLEEHTTDPASHIISRGRTKAGKVPPPDDYFTIDWILR